MKSNISVYAPLKTQKQYLKLILSRVINRFGDSIDAIAYSLLAYEITGSASMMALVLTVNYLPTVIIQPIAGIVTEQLHPARLMAACDLGRGVCVLLEALLYAFGLLSTPLIVLGVLINSTLEALSMPTGVGIVPRILQADLYTPGISLQRTLCSATELIGLACAGAIVSLLGIPFALGIDAATFLISAAIIVTIRPAPLENTLANAAVCLKDKLRTLTHDLRTVFEKIMRLPILRALLAMGMSLNLVAVPYSVFFTPYVTSDLGGDAYLLSILQVTFVLGTTLGAYLTPHLSRLSTRMQFLIGGIGAAFCYVCIALLPGVPLYTLRVALSVAVSCAFGGLNAMMSIAFSASFMRCVPKEELTRISGSFNALLTCAMPAGSLLCSLLVRYVSVPALLGIAGALCLVLFWAISRAKTYHEM